MCGINMVEAKKAPDTTEDVKTKENTKNKLAKKAPKEEKPVKESAKKPVAKKETPVPAANRVNFVTKLKKFMRGSWVELKKVNWLGRKELIAFTGVVLVSVVIVGTAIFLVDTLLSKGLSVLLSK